MNKTRILVSTSTNPWFNLAVEEVIFRKMDPFHRVLFVWRNAETVVIGRAQNPWRECNIERMKKDNIKLARRQSGGGAVFHDLGNTNFTFMAGKPEYDKTVSTQVVIDALKQLDINAIANGRNDLVVEEGEIIRKFSGSAYREAKDRGFHHGTLLLSADLSRLANYLTPNPKKLAAKGITSVKSRVTNLNTLKPDIDHDRVSDALINAYLEYYQDQVDIEYISPESVSNLPSLEDTFKLYSSWEWNYGYTPEFTHSMDERFDWGSVEVCLNVLKGQIVEANIYTDSLDPAPFESLAFLLNKCEYNQLEITDKMQQTISEFPNNSDQLVEFSHWFLKEIE
ncbi:lipoate--protein ligase [Psychromonas sp. PT13]|uniref:lipoate--protein ligase n=1 Tax=Psychromonas sp. PT13 TaxID=3439547 RepID=UPI003EBFE6EA